MVIAGLLGAGLWAWVAFATEYEFAVVACLIGVFVGAAAYYGSGGHLTAINGLLAVAVTCASITLGKMAIVEIMIQDELSTAQSQLFDPVLDRLATDDEYVISYLADDVAMERTDAGETLAWPGGDEYEEREREADYPAAIWAEAEALWEGMSPADRQDYREELIENQEAVHEALMGYVSSEARDAGILGMFHPMDLLFYAIAMYIAYRAGSGRIAAEG